MNDKRNIIALNKLAIELDQLVEYRLSEDIDNLIRTAILWNGPKLRFDHPGVKDLRDNDLEKLPPQSALESAYQWITSQPGKTLPRIKLPFMPSINWTPEKFFADIFRDYESTERISEDLINLLLLSPVFADLFHDYLYVQNEGNTRLLEAAKKMLAEAEPLLVEKLNKEFKKSKIYIDKRPLDTNLGKITSSLLKMSEILPREFLSQVQATKEWIEHQKQIESEMIDARYNTYEGKPYISRNKAHDELREYLKPAEEKVDQLIRNSNIINKICKIANTLDNSGYYKEANSLTNIMKRLAEGFVGHPKEFQDRSIEMAGEDKVKEWNEKYTDTTDPMKSKSQVLHDIKATWNQEVDRNFIQSLSFVHFGRASEIDKIMNMTDLELSCIAYKKPPYKNIWWGNAGLLIDGRVTLAGNTDLITNQHVYMSIQTTGKPRKWTNIMDLVLNEDDFVEDQFNEFLLVNWKPIAVIKSYRGNLPLDDKNMTAEQLAEKHNLPLIDENGQRIK